MPPSVSTPSTSRPTRRIRFASASFDHLRAARARGRPRASTRSSSLRERDHVRSIARRMVGIRDASRGRARPRPRRCAANVSAGMNSRAPPLRAAFARGPAAARCASRRRSRARRTRRASARRCACRPRDRRSRRTCPRSVTATDPCLAAVFPGGAPHLGHRAVHSFGLQPLPLLDIHRFPGGACGLEQIGLAAEERRDLQHVDHACRRASH